VFKKFFEKRRIAKEVKEWKSTPLGQQIDRHTQDYFYSDKIMSNQSEEFKQQIITDFYGKVFSVLQAKDPLIELREQMAIAAVSYATYQVLCLSSSDKQDGPYANTPYISGDLQNHIKEAAEYNEQLKEVLWGNPDISTEELIDFCNTQCSLLLYYLNGFNCIRIDIKDYHSEKDWLQPFIKSMLIWHEHIVRQDLNMPLLLPNDIDGLMHSTFMNIVINGCTNPLREWEEGLPEH
jgi:hypothetical protein